MIVKNLRFPIGIIVFLIIGFLCIEFFSLETDSPRNPTEAQTASGRLADSTDSKHLNDREALEYCRELLGKKEITGLDLRLLYRQKKISMNRFVRCMMRRMGEFSDIESRLEIAQVISDNPAFHKWYAGMLNLALDAPSSSIEQKVTSLNSIHYRPTGRA